MQYQPGVRGRVLYTQCCVLKSTTHDPGLSHQRSKGVGPQQVHSYAEGLQFGRAVQRAHLLEATFENDLVRG